MSGPTQADLEPRFVRWPAGRAVVRAHPSEFGATEPDRRRDHQARFSPLTLGRAVVPVLYGAQDAFAAASETVFHSVPAVEGPGREVRPRQIPLAPYRSWVWSTVAPERDLRLVSLRGEGLRALGTTRRALILSGRRSWCQTRQLARVVYAAAEQSDGLLWTSRQAPRREALMLFFHRRGREGGVARSELTVVEPPLPFLVGDGLERLLAVASELDITLLVD